MPSLLGRAHETALLDAEVDRLLTSHGGLVLVTGEAGIGKSALVADVTARAAQRGALVLAGACGEDDGAPGYWPWVQVVRRLARTAGTSTWAAVTEAAGDRLPVLLGEPGAGGSAVDDADPFRLHDAFTSVLATASASRPIAVVLEDLHRADPASLRLLDFVARHSWFEQVLVIGTYRDVEVAAPGHPLRPLLLPLLSRATVVQLTGLATADVATLVSRVAGVEITPAQAADVHRCTGGNPFFVEQTAHLGPELDIGPGVRDAVQQRLGLLPAPTVDVLRAAAVIGHEFPRDLLAAVVPARGDVEAHLQPAVTTRLVTRLGPDRLAFTHDLVRQRLVEALPAAERRALHAAVVGRLVSRRGTASGVLAHHARLAVPDVPAAVAVDHLVAAARDAATRQAAEEAVRHLRAAVPLAEPSRAADLRVELAAQLDRAGELDDARTEFAALVTEARDRDDAVLLARAALGLHRLGNEYDEPDIQIALMDEALAALERLPAADPKLIARVLAAAGMARTHGAVDEAGATAASRRAVALAREHGDDATLGWCLLAHHDAVWEPGSAAERIAILDELTAVARRGRDGELEALASFLRTVARLEQGRPDAVVEFATFEELTARSKLPRHRYLALSRRAALATLTGRFGEARAAMDDALAFGERVGEVDRMRVWRDQAWALDLLRGDVPEAERVARSSTPGDPFVGVLEGLTAAHTGDGTGALRRLAEVEKLLRGTPRRFRSMWLVFLAQVAAATGDAELCARARAAIAPLSGTWAVLSGAGVIWGPIAHWAAVVDAAQGRWDAAVAGFTDAARAADRLGARPWAVLARGRLGEALLGRGGADDAAAAATELERARREAAELGMVVRFAEEPRREPDAAPNTFRFDGQVWTLRYAGRTVHVRDAKGLHDLRTLLARPGTDVPAAELAGPAGDPALARSRRLGADPVLDERARDAYRARLRSLDDRIREALDRHDDGLAATLDRERDALIDELRRATGLGGRARRLGDSTERARQAVTARIRDILRRLREVHPELAEHLQHAVATGTSCSYRPEAPTRWSFR